MKLSKHDFEKYVVLFFDGYRSHLSLEALRVLANARVLAVAIPSPSSHLLQPLDMSCFRPYKDAVRRIEQEKAAPRSVSSSRSSPLPLKDIIDCIVRGMGKGLKDKNIESGFKKSGLWPISPALPFQFLLFKDKDSNAMVGKWDLLETYELAK